jgi:hypothetical protein
LVIVLKNLIVYMILSSLAVNMSPDKSYRPYISLACGLILMLILLNPIVNIISDDDSLLQSIEDYMDISISASDGIDFSISDIMGAMDEAAEFLSDLPDYETVSEMASENEL